jgi:hypothetical protein
MTKIFEIFKVFLIRTSSTGEDIRGRIIGASKPKLVFLSQANALQSQQALNINRAQMVQKI